MLFLEPEKRKEYLMDLGNKLEEINKDFAGVIKSEAEYQGTKVEMGAASRFPIEESGFPSAPSFRQDIVAIYRESKSFEEKARRMLEKLKEETYGEGDRREIRRNIIYVPAKTLETFIEDSSIRKGITSTLLYKFDEVDGWFELIQLQREEKKKGEKTTIPGVLLNNSDEVVSLMASGGLGIFVNPWFGLTYPVMLLLKSAKKKENKTYLLGDTMRLFKAGLKESATKLTDVEGLRKDYFKYLHPLNGSTLPEPVLVHRSGSGDLNVRSNNNLLEDRLKNALNAGDTLFNLLSIITYPNYHADDSFSINRDLFEGVDVKKTIDFVKAVRGRKVNISGELYQLNEKELKDLETIFKDTDIKVPGRVYVDKLGTLYPSPVLWFERGPFLGFQETYLKYILENDTNIPLAIFTENLEFLSHIVTNYFPKWDSTIGFRDFLGTPTIPSSDTRPRINQGYAFVNREQFALKDPDGLYQKISIPSGLLNRKKKLYDAIRTLSNLSISRLYDGVSIMTEGKNLGRFGELIDLQTEIQNLISDVEKGVEGRKLSQSEIVDRYDAIRELQRKVRENYGKNTEEVIKEINKAFY